MVTKYCNGGFSQKLPLLITDMLEKFDIDPSTITIIPWKLHSAAAATRNFLFVNEQQLNKFNYESRQWVIAHEIIHLLYDDHVTNSILKRIFKDELNDSQHCANQIKRFQEIRADVLSALKDAEYAKGYRNFFEKYLQLEGHVMMVMIILIQKVL